MEKLKTCIKKSRRRFRLTNSIGEVFLALGIFIYSKLNRSSDAIRLIDELRKIQDDEGEQTVKEKNHSNLAEDPIRILAYVEAEKRLSLSRSCRFP
ncbi:hypothetical protein KIN20_019932 [Parelaphostrongylus tenuis]|uniref:Uncharacterized protein n=1 Tax=Parelaphostrongylus tenuis TaxID=148309 RepID=A0AAD5MLS2_PARTN|nr:hypothetical protein KIN20_019932 [Parelaphostrongylus tenuis]